MVDRRVLAAVAAFALFWPWDANAQTTGLGCCTCPSQNICKERTAAMCDIPLCTFVLGGHCDNGTCVGPATHTPTAAATNTPTATDTGTPTETPTGPPTDTPTAADTGTPTDTPTAVPSDTPPDTPTDTPVPGTPTATGTVTLTASHTGTVTDTPTQTPTATPPCRKTPAPGCRRPSPANRWVFRLRDHEIDMQDRLVWKWRGAGHSLSEFGTPLTTTSYALCVYAGTTQAFVTGATAPAGGTCGTRPCWKQRDGRRFKYIDRDETPDGLTRVVLRARPSKARANLVVVGRGPNLDMPMLPLTQPVLVQLTKSDGTECWEAEYSAPALKSTMRQFRDKND